MPDFEEIYRQHFADVYRYALALSRDEAVTEEVTQETFFRALSAIDEFRGDCQLRVWLCQIARNRYLSLCRERNEQLSSRWGGESCRLNGQKTQRNRRKQLRRFLHDQILVFT